MTATRHFSSVSQSVSVTASEWARAGEISRNSFPNPVGRSNLPTDQSKVSDGTVPMLGVTVARRGRIVFSASAAAPESARPLHPHDTVLRIYSMSKPVTSVAALMLTGRVATAATD